MPGDVSMDVNLADLGWNDDWQRSFAAAARPGSQPGRVVIEQRHFYRVVTTAGEILAQIPGRMLKLGRDHPNLPTVGDWVVIRSGTPGSPSLIESVLPRRTRIARKTPGRAVTEQVLATNVDVAFIVQAVDRTFNLRRIERFLLLVRDGGVLPVVLLNKADVVDSVQAMARFQADVESIAGGAPVIPCSARTGRSLGQIRCHIRPDTTCVFLGVSGAGKSSLINRLHGESVQGTIEVRSDDDKGRHATTSRELFLLPKGGLVIDTPGVRELHPWEVGAAMDEVFDDIVALGTGCRFRDCSHRNEPGCAVQAAVDSGALPRPRLESFLKLSGERETMSRQRRRGAPNANARPRPADS